MPDNRRQILAGKTPDRQHQKHDNGETESFHLAHRKLVAGNQRRLSQVVRYLDLNRVFTRLKLAHRNLFDEVQLAAPRRPPLELHPSAS